MYTSKINEEKLNSLSLADLAAVINHLLAVERRLLELEVAANGTLHQGDKKARKQHEAKLRFLAEALHFCDQRRNALVADIFTLETPCGQNAFEVALSDHEAPFS